MVFGRKAKGERTKPETGTGAGKRINGGNESEGEESNNLVDSVLCLPWFV